MSTAPAFKGCEQPDHPLCPTCGVAMWLVEIERFPGSRYCDRWHFECKACESKAVVPPLA